MAATFKVERTEGFTIMSNYHLRDKSLSLKARGLLSYILSLPPDWDYSEASLAAASGAGKSMVASALHELEDAGYIERRRIRREDGTLSGTEYIVREKPVEPAEDQAVSPSDPEGSSSLKANGQQLQRTQSKNGSGKPFSPKPENREQVSKNATLPKPENQVQVSTSFTQPKPDFPEQVNQVLAYKDNNKELSTKRNKDLSFLPEFQQEGEMSDEGRKEGQYYRQDPWALFSRKELDENVKEQIDYSALAAEYDSDELAEIVCMIGDVISSKAPEFTLGAHRYSAETVKERFKSLSAEHVRSVLDNLDKAAGARNPSAYIRTMLFNAPACCTLSERSVFDASMEKSRKSLDQFLML